MSVKSAWVPKSEKGREVVRTLKTAGYPATYENTMGRYLSNTPAGRGGLFQDVQTMIELAFVLDPEGAETALNDAAARADAIVSDPGAYGLDDANFEQEYDRAVLELI